MNKVEAGYELLVLLAISDNHFHHSERENIKSFLEIHFSSKYEVFKIENPKTIFDLSYETKLEHLVYLADYFKKESIKTQLKMINFALKLILADRKITKEEKLRFKIVGEYWNIDLEKFIEKKLKKGEN